MGRTLTSFLLLCTKLQSILDTQETGKVRGEGGLLESCFRDLSRICQAVMLAG